MHRLLRPTLALSLLFTAGCVRHIPSAPEALAHPSAHEAPASFRPCLLVNGRFTKPLAMGVSELNFDDWHGGYATIVLPHPSGTLLIDPAFSRAHEKDLARMPPWFRFVAGDAAGTSSTRTELEKVGLRASAHYSVLLTHAHWDHVGGLRDLYASPVLLSNAEAEFVDGLTGTFVNGVLLEEVRAVRHRFQPFEFDGPAYGGFERSHDVLGDGTVIAVPLPGHTPGSTGYFVNAAGGKRYLFVGDASWTFEGIRAPEFKNPVASLVVGEDAEATGRSLALLHGLHEQQKDLAIIPAHDFDAVKALPECTAELVAEKKAASDE